MQNDLPETKPELPNYYILLDVDFQSSLDEIKKVVLKHAQAQTVELEILQGCKQYFRDEQSRAKYDALLLSTYPEFKAQLVAREKELAKKRREKREAAAQGKTDSNEQTESENKEKKRGCMDIVSLIATGLVLSVIFHNCSGSRDGGSSRHSEGAASYACKEAVKAMMKSPTQAIVSFDKYTPNGGTYTFFGTVDAPNSFGVMLRSNVSCTATHQSGSNYTTSVNIQK